MGVVEDFHNALEKNHTLVLSGLCSIEYQGRVEAYLPEGDRIILIKSDNTLLVHQPQGNNPINYMRASTQHRLELAGEGYYLYSQNLQSKEHLAISITKLHLFQSLALKDEQKQVLAGNEADMSNMLYEQPSLIEEGFKPLSREEHTKYGFIDVFGYDKNGVLTVVECKRIKADLSAVTQLRRYVEKIKKAKGVERVRGIVAAPTITQNALQMATDWGFGFIIAQPPKNLTRDKKQQALAQWVHKIEKEEPL